MTPECEHVLLKGLKSLWSKLSRHALAQGTTSSMF